MTGAELTSHPDGIFSFEEGSDKIGEWVIPEFSGDQSSIKLTGNLRLEETLIGELSSYIVAIVNLKIKETTFSGSKIEKVVANLTGSAKDDSTIFKGVRSVSYAKNIEFRF